jgi:hypothetical protein
MNPRIVCAANQYSCLLDETNLLIVIGARHWDSIMRDHFRLIADRVERKSEIQGFIDQFGKFYTRQEAFVIAEENNQIIRRVGGDNGKLFSENLY